MSITVTDIKKKYGRQQVLNGISFSAGAGEIIGFTGRNGCGKTTLLSIIAGVEKPDEGKIVFPSGKASIGYLPQINPLLEMVTVKDNLDLWCNSKEEEAQIIERFQLQDMRKKKVKYLSGGMKRRLALACAIANRPDILIMDEPTAALDIEYKRLIHEEMMDYVANKGTIIMVTHEKEEVEMCSQCYIINNGMITQTK